MMAGWLFDSKSSSLSTLSIVRWGCMVTVLYAWVEVGFWSLQWKNEPTKMMLLKPLVVVTTDELATRASSSTSSSKQADHPIQVLKINELQGGGDDDYHQAEKKDPLDPIQVLEEWKKYHSIEAIRHQSNGTTIFDERKFILTKFQCPYQVGVQVATLLNDFLLAVATNRTLLYQYHAWHGWARAGENKEEQCYSVLKPAHWIPQYKELAPHLPEGKLLSSSHPDMPPMYQLDSSQNLARFERMMTNPKKKHITIALDSSNVTVLQMGRLWNRRDNVWMKILDLRKPYASTYFAHVFGMQTPLHQQERIQRLYKEGPIFLHGMLFRALFDFAPTVVESVQQDMIPSDRETVFSIGMHSRHTKKDNDGSDIHRETTCLDLLLARPEAKQKPCTLYLMSDRRKTVAGVAEYGRQRNCSIVMTTAPIKRNSSHANLEHGAFAGAGYFQDLLVTSQARSAYMSNFRSSSLIPYELMEYSRRIEAWEREGVREMEGMLACILGRKGIHQSS